MANIFKNENNELNLIQNHYVIGRKIGSGAFGEIFLCDCPTRKQEYVMKREKLPLRVQHLLREYECLKHLADVPGIPSVLWYGSGKIHNYMVVELLGPNLEHLYQLCDKKFSTPTLVHISTEVIKILRDIHNLGVIHRDPKPKNFCVGLWPKYCRKIYLIDLGISMFYVERNSSGEKCHIPMPNPSMNLKNTLNGTVRFCGVDAHYGNYSRKSDLIVLANTILYFLRGGNLPWMGLKVPIKTKKYRNILSMKLNTPIRALYKDFPSEYRIFMECLQKLKFFTKPDYRYYILLFKMLLDREGFDDDESLDWEKKYFLRQPWPPAECFKTLDRKQN